MAKQHYYVGVWKGLNHYREVFRSAETPTERSGYAYVIGPFVTKRGAQFMTDFGRNNPHCQTVDDAEQLAKVRT